MNTKKDCCAHCCGRMGTLAGGGTYCQVNREGCCHTDSTKKESFSDFFHNASPEEKERVMLEIAREATNDQRAQIGLPPLHTSPEKEIDPNQMMHDLHEEVDRISHVKEPSEEMKAKLKKGAEMFKRDHGEQFNELAKETEPSFTEKTLSSFKEWHKDNNYTADSEEIEQWLSSKLSEIDFIGFQRGQKDGYEGGKNDTIHNVLTLIESKKKEIHEVDSELFGWGLIGEEGQAACCPGDDAAYGYEIALTSLAEELLKHES